MYTKYYTKQFKKSFRKILNAGKIKREEIEKVVDILASNKKLDIKYKDHALRGELLGNRECHVKPDVLLVYRIEKKKLVLILIDIGSHANLF